MAPWRCDGPQPGRRRHDLAIYNLDPSRVEDLTISGARPGASGEEVAGEVEVLFTSLPGPHQTAAAMPRLIDALRPGATWVDITTNDRDLVLELAQRAEARHITDLDEARRRSGSSAG